VLYFDNNATTQTDDEVVEAMLPYFRSHYFNASSIAGISVGIPRAINAARHSIARLIGAQAEEIFLTSGATESNNWVISAVAEANPQGCIIASSVEHDSIYQPLRHLESCGYRVKFLPVNSSGQLELETLSRGLSDSVALVSVMMANNETGVIQDIQNVSGIVKQISPQALFHTDATQALGKISIDLNSLQSVDFLSFSAHKFHGPKGIGGLFIREGYDLEPFMYGGGQQDGRRPGTENIPLIIGLGKAAERILSSSPDSEKLVEELRDRFETSLKEKFPTIIIVGENAPRLPNTTLAIFKNIDGRDVVDHLAASGIAVSTGAACSQGAEGPSRILLAAGFDYTVALGAIRISISRYTSWGDCLELLKALETAITSPHEC
jgi:cysteine desulfurase